MRFVVKNTDGQKDEVSPSTVKYNNNNLNLLMVRNSHQNPLQTYSFNSRRQ